MADFVMLCGLPGSGKSRYAKSIQDALGHKIVCPDSIRKEWYGDESIQGNGWAVFKEVFRRIVNHLRHGENVIFDATNISSRGRKDFLENLKKAMENSNIEIIYKIVMMDTALQTCLRRNSSRARKVPEEVILRMSRKFSPPTMAEGWDFILFTQS